MVQTNALAVVPQLTPQVWNMIEAIANVSFESRKFGVTSRGEAALKFLFCYENGLALSAANTGLYIVNGKIAAQGNIIAAQIRKHPTYDYRIKSINDKGCTVEILRLVDGAWRTEGEASFTEEDAKRAGLLSKENYQSYPSDLYFNRALARAQKRFAPDAFGQPVYTPEELGLKADDENGIVEGTWTVVPSAPTAETPKQAGISLDALLTQYGAEAIMAANEGRIPGTDEELQAVAAALEAGNVA